MEWDKTGTAPGSLPSAISREDKRAALSAIIMDATTALAECTDGLWLLSPSAGDNHTANASQHPVYLVSRRTAVQGERWLARKRL